MFSLHWKMALICGLLAVAVLLIVDSQYNGAVIDLVEDIFGRRVALWVMHHETGFVIAFIFLTIFISFFVLERYFMEKTDRIFRNIGVLFQKDDRYLSLDEEFALLEEDLNELKRESMRSERLVQMENKQKLDIITYLAHDIRTPLASVIGYLCLLDEEPTLPEEVRRRYISLTLEKAYRLEHLVNEFFDITRLHVGKIPLEKETVNLACMMQQLADEFYPMAENHGRRIVVEVPEDLQVCADPDKIARVFTNILKNALAYGELNSPIGIVAEERADTVVDGQASVPVRGVQVSISNAGQEIPQEELEHVFDQFYRLDQSRRSDTGGSGLGLAIAKEIVKEHRGRIWADSRDGETTFRVWLPLAERG